MDEETGVPLGEEEIGLLKTISQNNGRVEIDREVDFRKGRSLGNLSASRTS